MSSARPIGPYGRCPICGAEGTSRERRLNGDDTCALGHRYPSLTAQNLPAVDTETVLREENERLRSALGDIITHYAPPYNYERTCWKP